MRAFSLEAPDLGRLCAPLTRRPVFTSPCREGCCEIICGAPTSLARRLRLVSCRTAATSPRETGQSLETSVRTGIRNVSTLKSLISKPQPTRPVSSV